MDFLPKHDVAAITPLKFKFINGFEDMIFGIEIGSLEAWAMAYGVLYIYIYIYWGEVNNGRLFGVYIYIYVYVYINYMYMCIYIYAYLYKYMYVYIQIYVYICI